MTDFDWRAWFARNWGWIPLTVFSPLVFALPGGFWPLFPITVWYIASGISTRRVRKQMVAELKAVLNGEPA